MRQVLIDFVRDPVYFPLACWVVGIVIGRFATPGRRAAERLTDELQKEIGTKNYLLHLCYGEHAEQQKQIAALRASAAVDGRKSGVESPNARPHRTVAAEDSHSVTAQSKTIPPSPGDVKA
jgi:hypothetical protein